MEDLESDDEFRYLPIIYDYTIIPGIKYVYF